MTTARDRLGLLIGALIAILAFVAVAYVTPRQATEGPGEFGRAGLSPTEADTRPGVDANEEQEEQSEGVRERVEAWEAALAAGKAGQTKPKTYLTGAAAPAATGWVGEFPIDTTVDDWEPAVAADPNSSYVYVLTTRYGTEKPCPGNCPTPWIALTVSVDNGATWSPARPLCACKGGGQFDPIIEVVPDTGDVYSLFMIGFNVVFIKSTDHGATWTAPVPTWGNVSWNDKPILAVSDDGQEVYAAFNGPTGGDPWIARSLDAGETWTSQVKLIDSGRYVYAFDGDVASDGTVYVAESSLQYKNAGNKGPLDPGVEEHLFISRDHGRTWIDKVIARAQPGLACVAVGCHPDFYTGHAVVSADATGALVFLYDAATTFGGKQSIYATRSTNQGRTWSTPVVVSTAGEEATTPMVESGAAGDVRIAWAETSGGGNVDAWNTWYRRSTDGGVSWSAPIRISDATSGAPYKTAAGYAEVYGDYGEIAITSVGKTIATWGEGISYTGPGGVWVNREQ
jgi:hypothetical protein